MHEFRQIDEVFPILRVMIGQDAIIDEFPPKGVRNDDDDSLGRDVAGRFGDVHVVSVQFGHLAERVALVGMAAEAVWAGHDGLPCRAVCVW